MKSLPLPGLRLGALACALSTTALPRIAGAAQADEAIYDPLGRY